MNDLPFRGVGNQSPMYSDSTSASFLHEQTLISSMTAGPRGGEVTGDAETETMIPLPDDAWVVRGGENLPSSFTGAVGSSFDATGKLDEVSVNSAAGLTVSELTKPNRRLRLKSRKKLFSRKRKCRSSLNHSR